MKKWRSDIRKERHGVERQERGGSKEKCLKGGGTTGISGKSCSAAVGCVDVNGGRICSKQGESCAIPLSRRIAPLLLLSFLFHFSPFELFTCAELEREVQKMKKNATDLIKKNQEANARTVCKGIVSRL